MKITDTAVKRRIATSVIAVALVVLGVYGLFRLPVNFLPDMTYPLIKIHIWWRGATPDEINTNLADPIERQMATVDGLDFLESSSIEGMYTLQANFKYDVDVDVAYQDSLAAMARAVRQLPKDIDPPVIIKADPSQLPVVQLTIRSEHWDLTKLRTWADNWLQDQMLAVDGVAGTEVVGGLKREIRIHLDPLAMEKYSLSLPAVIKRLQEENLEQFGGRVTAGPREIIARTMGEYRSMDDIRAIVLVQSNGSKITLADIAEVRDAHEEVRVITRLDSRPAVKLSVLKQADANTVAVAIAVYQKLNELRPNLPAGIALDLVENQADYVVPALKGVRNAAAEAAILVFIVVYLFLGSWRQVVVMLAALPVTLLLNFALMKLAGFSLNIFSLGGLVVAIGVVLDNSIVVIENITRLRHETPGESPGELAVQGTAKVGPAILAATLSFIALFIPFLLVPGLTSLLFRELILVIAGIVCISLAVAVTLTPMLTAILFGGRSAAPERESRFEQIFEKVTDGYGWILSRILRARWAVIPGFIAVLAGAVLLAPGLGSEFLPQMDDGRVMVKVKLPTGAALGETDRVLHEIEAKLTGDPLIESAFTLAGGKVWGLYTYEIANEGQIDIQLVPRHRRDVSTDEYIRRLRPVVSKIPVPGGKAMVMQSKIKGLRSLGEADIEVKIKGMDMEKLFTLAQKTAQTMNSLNQFTNVYLSLDMTKPEYQVLIDRTRAAELGISVADVAVTVRSLLSGAVATRYREGDDFYNIRVMIPEERITSRRDIENLVLNCAQGGYLRLSDVAEVRQAVGPVEIVREDQIRTVVVRGDAAGASVGQALASLQKGLQDVTLPPGYRMYFGGQAQMMAEMKDAVLMILGFAVFFAFVVLAVQFDSLKLPAVILGSVPFCVAGMIYALQFTGIPMGATVLIGLLVVVAATVNEGVLLLTVVEELRTRNQVPVFEALVQAAKIRLRPRLMIAAAVIAGFIPLALNLEEGGDMLQPMAVGAIGGLTLGIFVAVFLLPCIYLVFTREKNIEIEKR
ncbi:MAG: efflux RND transporter permease subunit [Desulfobacteraceae bacterium]|nr:MAG: efflux RND transporter permease subunit [Desulfobacteraceae bacterium]